MGETQQKIQKKCHSLMVRLPLMFVISGLLIVIMVAPMIYFWLWNRMVKDYTRMAEGVTNLMAHQLDGNMVQDYLEKKFEMVEYRSVRRLFQDLKMNYPELRRMYVYRIQKDGEVVIFDLGENERLPGEKLEVQGLFQPYLEEMSVGRSIPVIRGKGPDKNLLTSVRPIYDTNGDYQCYVCVDFSMEEVSIQNKQFLLSAIGILVALVGCILLFDIYVIRRKIARPLRDMSECTKGFTYDTEAERFKNVQSMEELNIQTHDEIEDLYYEFMSVMKESLYYMTNLSRAKNDIQEQEEKLGQISETAYKDALTRVGNPAAFNKLMDTIAAEMTDKKVKFAIVMVDVNNLKYVNDTCGHKFGDAYIKGCCNIICKVYKRSPVFRVGGDEFVVVLRNEDYMSRLLRMTQITEAFMSAYGQQDKQIWERYSASVGMAEREDEDESPDQVIKRADKAMYEYKEKFKKKYGSYR